MGNYILCHERRAKRPYYIEAAGVNIWTIEELCYFLCEYVWLVDRSLLSEKLCDWVDKELQMPRLAKLLYAQAQLIAGIPLEDPAGYSELVCSLMQ